MERDERRQLIMDSAIVLFVEKGVEHTKERGRNNFRNYASQLQATFARSQIPKASK